MYINKTLQARVCDTLNYFIFEESVWSNFIGINMTRYLFGVYIETKTLQGRIPEDRRNC